MAVLKALIWLGAALFVALTIIAHPANLFYGLVIGCTSMFLVCTIGSIPYWIKYLAHIRRDDDPTD